MPNDLVLDQAIADYAGPPFYDTPAGVHVGHHRLHVHLRAEEIGAPALHVTGTAAVDATVSIEAGDIVAFEVADDSIEQAARAKFAVDNWRVIEDDRHDMDIEYDGLTYTITAWVR